MTDLVIFAGPNGSGKSSARDAIVNPVEVVIDPDRIAREINPANPSSGNDPAGRAAVRLFDESIAQGKSVSMETTLTGHSAVMRMQRAKEAGYTVGLIYVALNDPEMNVRRVAARVRQGGHSIPPETVRKRVGTSLANLPWAIAIADQAIVLDNSGQTHRRILETAAGRVTYLAEHLPQWLSDRMPDILAALKTQSAPSPETLPLPAKPRRSAVSGILDSLRRPEPETAAPWTPALTSMAERLAAFERAGVQKAQLPEAAAPDPTVDDRPKPSKGPRP